MNIRTSTFLFIFSLYFQTLTLISSFSDNNSLNTSNLVFVTTDYDIVDHPRTRQHQFPHFLEDVMKKISVMRRWKLEDVRVSKLDLRTARIGRFNKYVVHLRIGVNDLIFRVSDDVVWRKKLTNVEVGVGGDFGWVINEIRSVSVIDSFKVEGPFELQAEANDELTLFLPGNTTHNGLRRILVGEGITVEVKGAQEVSLLCSSELDLPLNKSFVLKQKTSNFLSFGHSSCAALLPVHILGNSSIVAYKTRNPDAYIKTIFLTKTVIEMLPEKCNRENINRKWVCPIESLRLRIAFLEKLFRSFLAGGYQQLGMLGSVKVKIKASAVVRFQLELERHIRRIDILHEWKTSPTVERVWFEIIARVEEESIKPLIVKEVKPLIAADSIAWSNLMPNISFTEFPSFLVPPEALTLDVKWQDEQIET